MKIKIDEINNKIQIDLNPKDYFIRKTNDGEEKWHGDYALVHQIDMSYCGKPNQEGSVKIFLSESEYQKLKGLIDEIC